MLNRQERNVLKQRLDSDFKRFNDEIWNYLQVHPEYQQMFEYHIKHENKFKSVKWGESCFDAWSNGKLDWFMNHSLIEYENKQKKGA